MRPHLTVGRRVEINVIIQYIGNMQFCCDQVTSLATFNDDKLTIVQTAKKAGDKSTTVEI